MHSAACMSCVGIGPGAGQEVVARDTTKSGMTKCPLGVTCRRLTALHLAPPPRSESENRAFKELLKLSVVEMEVADANEAILPPGRGAGRRGDGAGRFGPVGAGSLERAVHTVAHWMGTGVCDKRTADNFYVYLQGFHAKLKELRALDAERTKQRHEEDAVHLNTLFVKVSVLGVQPAFGFVSTLLCSGCAWMSHQVWGGVNPISIRIWYAVSGTGIGQMKYAVLGGKGGGRRRVRQL